MDIGDKSSKEITFSVYAYQINFTNNNDIFTRNEVKKMEIKKRMAQMG